MCRWPCGIRRREDTGSIRADKRHSLLTHPHSSGQGSGGRSGQGHKALCELLTRLPKDHFKTLTRNTLQSFLKGQRGLGKLC